jgi:nuclear pore complex protein Nup62
LDTYESQIKTIFEESNLQQPMQPADKQRENAYSLAENLNSQLDDVNRNLNIMVEEINKMSSAKQISAADEDDVVSIYYIVIMRQLSCMLLNTPFSLLGWPDCSNPQLSLIIIAMD